MPSLTLSDLVALSGVPASTIHHYRRAGLLPAPAREAANRFRYDERHVEALRLVRSLRDRRALSLPQIATLLHGAGQAGDLDVIAAPPEEAPDARARVIKAAIHAFQTRSYGEVTVSDVTEAAGVAKGTLYRYFASKEALFTAAIEALLEDTAARFAAAVDTLGGREGLAHDPDKAAIVFARLVARALPILLELGARAAKGHLASQDLARRVLRTLAEAAGRPLAEDPIPAGLAVINTAFSTVLSWTVGPDWPPDEAPDEDLGVP